MEPAVAIGLVIVIAAFLGWWLWASRRARRVRGDGAREPRDAWDALNRGLDPTTSDEEPDDDGPSAKPGAAPDGR